MAEIGGAAVMTEGLACGDRDMDECWRVLGQLDEHLFSWTDYGDSQANVWSPSLTEQEVWARTYARAVAGQPRSMSFDPQSKDFRFCFELDTSILAPTEIFVSSTYSYPDGIIVEVTDNLQADSSQEDTVLVTPTDVA